VAAPAIGSPILTRLAEFDIPCIARLVWLPGFDTAEKDTPWQIALHGSIRRRRSSVRASIAARVAVGEGMGNLALIHTLTQNLITHSIPSPNLSTSNYPYSLDNG